MDVHFPYQDVLIIHIGGNDVGIKCILELLGEMKKIFKRVKQLFLGLMITFSEIVP